VLKVEKQLPSTDAERVDKFKAEVKPIVEGIEDVEMNVNCVLSRRQVQSGRKCDYS